MQGKSATEKFMAPASEQKKHTLVAALMIIGSLLILAAGIFELSYVLSYASVLSTNSLAFNALVANTIGVNSTLTHNVTYVNNLKNYIINGTIAILAIEIICGGVLIFSGIMVYRPKGSRLKLFSLVGIIFSLVSLIISAGFIVFIAGAVLGTIGGILGLMKK